VNPLENNMSQAIPFQIGIITSESHYDSIHPPFPTVVPGFLILMEIHLIDVAYQ